jgi:hypothetical protein
MMENNLYFSIWNRYLPVIRLQMKNAVNGLKEIKMSKAEFELYGKRKVSDYLIDLEINNGKVANNIKGITIARDLFDVISSDDSCKVLLSKNNYKLNMGKEFILRISIQ